MAAACEIEFAEAGTMVLEQAVTTPGVAWVVRRGAVELLDGDRVVDMLSEGEMFGHASLLSEWPTALAVRAAEDSLLYRLPAEAIRPVLARPAALRFAARSLAGRYEMLQRELDPLAIAVVDPARRPVSRLLRGDPVIAAPAATVQEAARRMVEASSSAVLVDLGDGFGIVTDRDLRERVVAAGVPADTPVSQVMTAPATTIADDVTGADALLDMLDRGVRHLPVVDASGRVIGVISDTDLMAVETRTPFLLRRAITAATTVDELAAAVAPLLGHHRRPARRQGCRRFHLTRDRHRPRRAHPPHDRAGRRRAPGRGAVHLAVARQRGPARGVPQLRPGQRDRLAGRGRRPGGAGAARARGRRGRGRPRALRHTALPQRRGRLQAAVPALAGGVAGRRAVVAGRSHRGEGADPGVADDRRPAGVDGRVRLARRRGRVRGRPPPSPAAAAAGPVRAQRPAAHGLLPRLRGRARRRAARHPRHQVRRAAAGRRHRPLGGDVGGLVGDLHRRAPGRGGAGRHARRPHGLDAAGRVRAVHRPAHGEPDRRAAPGSDAERLDRPARAGPAHPPLPEGRLPRGGRGAARPQPTSSA